MPLDESSESMGTLDDALGIISQLEAELDAIPMGGLATPFARNLLRDAISKTCEVRHLIEGAIAEDDKEHPEDLDMTQPTKQSRPMPPTRRPHYVRVETENEVTATVMTEIAKAAAQIVADTIGGAVHTVAMEHDGFAHFVECDPAPDPVMPKEPHQGSRA